MLQLTVVVRVPGAVLRCFSGATLWVWAHNSGQGCSVGTGQWLLASQHHTNLSAGFLTLSRAASWGAMGLLLAAPEGRNHWEGDAGLVGGISFPLGGPGIGACFLPST